MTALTPALPVGPPEPVRVPHPPSYPLRAEHQAWGVEQLAHARVLVEDMLSAEGAGMFERTVQDVLREGAGLKFAIRAVEAADKGDWLCDKALREVGAVFLDAMMQKQDLPLGGMQIVAYLQRVVGREPHRRKPGGHDEFAYWFRNVAICILIQLACKWFGVPPTRNRESRRADRHPSGVSLTAAALARHGVHISEAGIQNHIWQGVSGTLVREIFEVKWGRLRPVPR